MFALLIAAAVSQVTVVSSADPPDLRVAPMQAATLAPAVVARPAGVLHSSAAFVAAVPMRPLNRSQQCAGGVCQPAASEPRRAVQQYREHRQQYAQPAEQPQQYRFNGPLAKAWRGRR